MRTGASRAGIDDPHGGLLSGTGVLFWIALVAPVVQEPVEFEHV